MNREEPMVSVVLPVYNAAAYLREAVESILQQTLTDFELLLINDGSTDGSAEVMASFTDDRIQITENPGNKGLVYSLNAGLARAKGRYIARMDADDRAFPERFAQQVAFMQQFPEIGLCGTWYENMGDMEGAVQLETGHDAIVFRLLYQFHMLHPSWMMRKELLDRHGLQYELLYGEDYELLTRVIRHARIANIPQVLMRYRQFGHSMSKSNAAITASHCLSIRQRLFQDMGISLEKEELLLFEQIMHRDYRADSAFITSVDELLSKCHHQFDRDSRIISHAYFLSHIGELWFHTFLNTTSIGIWNLRFFFQSSIHRHYRPSFYFLLRFVIKCLTHR